MQPNTIFTRKKTGLDNNVWLVMLLCLLLSGGLLGYTVVKTKEEKDCKSMQIMVNDRNNIEGASFFVGQPITFRSAISPGDQLIWDFGDSTQKSGSAAVHVFNREGKFMVMATVNGKCPYYKNIRIVPARAVTTDSMGNILEDIIGKESALTGETITFSTSRKASSYHWYVENHRNYPQKYTKEITYSFSRQDTYTIVLVLDNDNSRKYTKVVSVASLTDPKLEDEKPRRLLPEKLPEPAPLEELKPKDTIAAHPEPKKPVTKYVPDESLKTYIQSVVCEAMKPEEFNLYFCLGVTTPVIVNNKERKPFSQFCSEIQAKKIKIESVQATRDGDCVVNIKVNYDKKGWLGRNPCKD